MDAPPRSLFSKLVRPVVVTFGIVIILVAIIEAIVIPSLIRSRIAANEMSAVAALKQLVCAEGVFRQTDADGNGLQDYWTRDVAGLYGTREVKGTLLIDTSLARADKDGGSHYPVVGAAAPYAGYWFGAMKLDEVGAPYQQQLGTSAGAYTNQSKYGFCAWPSTYDETGVRTYIVNEAGVVYALETGGKPIDNWPFELPTSRD